MKKGIKKTFTLILTVITILALYTQPVFAVSQKLLNEIEKTNQKIFVEVEKAQEKAEKEALKGKSQDDFEKVLDKIIDKLIGKTEKLSEKLLDEAAKEGVTLEKEYTEVLIYDRVVLVDPFYAH